MNKLTTFLESPSNRTGICLILSLLPGIVTQFAVHDTALSGVVTVVCAGILKIMQPDNTVAIATTAASAVVERNATAPKA